LLVGARSGKWTPGYTCSLCRLRRNHHSHLGLHIPQDLLRQFLVLTVRLRKKPSLKYHKAYGHLQVQGLSIQRLICRHTTLHQLRSMSSPIMSGILSDPSLQGKARSSIHVMFLALASTSLFVLHQCHRKRSATADLSHPTPLRLTAALLYLHQTHIC